MKYRACYNCVHYEDRGIDQLPIGSRPPNDLSGAEIRTTDFAPRCLRGLNPSLAHAPMALTKRMQGAFEPDTMAAFCDTYLWAPPVTGDKFRTIVRRRIEQNSRFSTANLPLKFVKFWDKGVNVRLKVEQGANFIRTETGYVAMSTGWSPVFVLVKSTKAKGSSVILSDDDRIVGIRDWQNERSFKPYRNPAPMLFTT